MSTDAQRRRARLNELRGADSLPPKFSHASEFARAVANAAVNAWDHRLEFKAVATGAHKGAPSAGGFMVPSEIATRWWERAYNVGRILQRCARFPVTSGNALKIPAVDEIARADGSRRGGIRFYRADEADTVTASKPTFRTINLFPTKRMALTSVTNELLADAPALAAWLELAFGEEAAFEIENDFINGDGAGKPQGILHSAALLTVDVPSGQSSGTVVAANFESMMARMWGPSRPTSTWHTSNSALAQVEGESFSNGKPVVRYDADGVPTIMGRPVYLEENVPALGSHGDVLLADWSQYAIGEKEPGIASSVHVRFLNDEACFRFRFNVDGSSLWRTPLTPKNSPVTQSPFVALAAR